MITIKKTYTLPSLSPDMERFFTEQSLFFDIETTGFSAKYETVYLIGYATRSHLKIHVTQLFAESLEDEPAILTSFMNVLESSPTLISFNGTGFDLPFLKHRCAKYEIADHFGSCASLDLMRSIRKISHFIQLPDCRQKTAEAFLGLHRDDLYSGGELIPVYKNYVKTKDSDALNLLLLHNYEDVVHMSDLLPLLSYSMLTSCAIDLESVTLQTVLDFKQNEKKELLFQIRLPFTLPVPVVSHADGIHASFKEDRIVYSATLCQEELLYFFPDYENYYYLPDEDTVIHKSLALFVDKNHRKKAKASNCYTKKEGLFLPLPAHFTCDLPTFYREYKAKERFIEFDETLLSQNEFLCAYTKQVIQSLFDSI